MFLHINADFTVQQFIGSPLPQAIVYENIIPVSGLTQYIGIQDHPVPILKIRTMRKIFHHRRHGPGTLSILKIIYFCKTLSDRFRSTENFIGPFGCQYQNIGLLFQFLPIPRRQPKIIKIEKRTIRQHKESLRSCLFPIFLPDDT